MTAESRHLSAALCVLLLGIALQSATPAAAEIRNGDDALARVSAQIENINTLELQEQLRSQPDTVLIDVRSPREILLFGGMIDAPRSYNIVRG